MKNMKIRSKLIASFSIVMLLASLIGAIGIFGVNQISAAGSSLYTDHMKPMTELVSIADYMQEIRVESRDLVIAADDLESVKALEISILANMAQLEEKMAKYSETIDNAEVRTAFGEISRLYTIIAPSLLDGIEAAKSGASKEVLLEKIGECSSAMSGIMDNLGKCVEVNIAEGNTSATQNSRMANQSLLIIAAIFAGSVMIAIILVMYVSGIISRPLSTMQKFLEKLCLTGDMSLSKQDMENIQEYSEVKDEVGQCIKSCAGVVVRLQDFNDKLGLLAQGDLTAELKVLSEKDGLGVSFTKMLDSLNKMFTELRNASEQGTAGAQQIAQGAQMLAAGSAEQAASIQEFSASLEKMEEETKNNADHSNAAKDANSKAVSQLAVSKKLMDKMLESMREIDESSNKITKVIKVIDDIAFQTNILALNASVEAARAGQHGKGFAVVAEEVRGLSSKSADAARETTGLIEGSIKKVNDGMKIVGDTNDSLGMVSEYMSELADLVEGVAQASTEQARSIEGLSLGMTQISDVVQANSATAEESAAAAEQMSAQSQSLYSIVQRYRLNNAALAATPAQSTEKLFNSPAPLGKY